MKFQIYREKEKTISNIKTYKSRIKLKRNLKKLNTIFPFLGNCQRYLNYKR